jgi:hypothetical protein
LKSFSEKYDITYPLLSDINSEVIRKFGILNTGIDSSSGSFGVPNPGIFIVNKNLIVEKKQFEKSYAARPSAENILAIHFNKELNSYIHPFKTTYLKGSIALSDTLAYRAQLLALVVKISLINGFHLYVEPIPEGYTPLKIDLISNPNFTLDSLLYPESEQITLKSINETFNIISDEIILKSVIRVKKKPSIGTYSGKLKISFQACNDKICMPPEELNFQFPITITNEIN